MIALKHSFTFTDSTCNENFAVIRLLMNGTLGTRTANVYNDKITRYHFPEDEFDHGSKESYRPVDKVQQSTYESHTPVVNSDACELETSFTLLFYLQIFNTYFFDGKFRIILQ